MIKNLILLISSIVLTACSNTSKVVFKNEQFKNELDSFIAENKQIKEHMLFIEIADEDDIFEEIEDLKNQDVFLTFYYSPPDSCIGFYKSFQYKGIEIFLFNFSDLIIIEKESIICNDGILLNGYVNAPPMRRYYFTNNNKIIEIKSNVNRAFLE